MISKFPILFHHKGALDSVVGKEPIKIQREADCCNALLASLKNIKKTNIVLKPTNNFLKKIFLSPVEMAERSYARIF